jgi:hypothetical protein
MLARRKPKELPATVNLETDHEPEAGPLAWEAVFKCQRSPVLRSELIGALMGGTVLQVERLPVGLLADAVLLATAAREHCEAEIVDDYRALLTRVEETFVRGDFSARVCDTTFLNKVSAILRGFGPFDDPYHLETRCVPELVRWYLAQPSLPAYFMSGEL